MTAMDEKIVIIGGGQAGAQAAVSLRQLGHAGEITLLASEETLPYQRPPLSKAYLAGDMDRARLFLKPEDFYAQANIDLLLGVSATGIDRNAKTVTLSAGDSIGYDKLVIATGAPPRLLSGPGAALEGVSYLRDLDDSERLHGWISDKAEIVIVGAGYIGLEAAATFRNAGLNVTVVEMADRVLGRVAGPEISGFFRKLHESAGVKLMLNAGLEAILGDASVDGVVLKGGEIIPANRVLVGIGAVPAISIAEDAGLAIDNGLVVDAFARTADPSIWAAGDCTNHPSKLFGGRLRLESVPNAIEQAKVAAANMMGKGVEYNAVPWFWSDQYDVKLQTAGISQGFDQEIIRGNPAEKSFSAWYLRDGRLLAVDAVNDPVSFMVSKRLIATKAVPDPKVLADCNADIKSLRL